jgi:hypothetical protein
MRKILVLIYRVVAFPIRRSQLAGIDGRLSENPHLPDQQQIQAALTQLVYIAHNDKLSGISRILSKKMLLQRDPVGH